MEIFQYAFMQRAFVVGLLLAVIIPCVGVIVVFKRLSMIGDALSHMSLAGIAAALGIEAIRKKIPKYAELSIAIIMSAGIGLAGVLSGYVKNAANFNSFLFGSIVAISDFELVMVAVIGCVVMLAFIFLFKELFFIALDERSARLAGVPVKTINFIFTILTAVTVSIAARTVGALVVSALMVIPVTCAMQFGKSYKQTVVFSIIFALLFTGAGLFTAYYARLKPGGTIVLIGVVCLVLILIVKSAAAKIRRVKTRPSVPADR